MTTPQPENPQNPEKTSSRPEPKHVTVDRINASRIYAMWSVFTIVDKVDGDREAIAREADEYLDSLAGKGVTVRGTYNLLEACRRHPKGLSAVVVASSDKAYGDAPVLPYTEEMPVAGRNPYDVSQSCADLLRRADGSFYVGSARDLEQRLAEHATGTVEGFTSRHSPVELVWALEPERTDDAAELERQIKGWRRARRLALIEGRLTDLPGLSRSGSHAATCAS